ncbi:MAG: 4Fe-4S double cluster binding domain-containing protein [Terriglobales bacterium]
MIDALNQWAVERGYRLACGGVAVLHDVRAELERRGSSGELDAAFRENNLGFFRYEKSSETIGEVKGVIAVAVRRPAHRLTFEMGTGPFTVTIPPTYVQYRAMFRNVRDEITAALPALRGHLDILLAPLKAVACRLGLVTYGRNNLTYIPDWGSYYQLLGYVTDADLGIADDWGPVPARLMPACESCGICIAACPTGAISDDRVLLRAERCTTLFSEQSGELERDLSADCIFGCLECQQLCPENDGLLRVEPAGVAFTKAETEVILADGADGARLDSVRQKLDVLGLTEAPLIARNLKYLIARRSQAR